EDRFDHAMVTVPASVWRGGSISRGLKTGLCVGVFLGGLAWLDSGTVLIGALVFVILATFYGIWMAHRMDKYWPEARAVTGEDGVAGVRAARRGEPIGDPRLAQSVVDYSRGLHAAAEKSQYRWLVWFLLAVAGISSLWDTMYGSTRDAVASCTYAALL